MRKTDVACVREVQKSLKQSVKKLIENKIEEPGVGHRSTSSSPRSTSLTAA